MAHVKAHPGTYGVGAVARLAESLGQDPILLYRYAGVAACWTEAEARDLVSRASLGGRTLTWSHLVVLATLDSRRERTRWTRRACVESLSVRELVARLGKCRQLSDESDGVVEKATRAADQFLTHCAKDGFESAGAATVRRRETLESALAVHETLHALAGRRVDALREALAALDEASRSASFQPRDVIVPDAHRHQDRPSASRK
jgi:hypothetical protein